LGLVFFMRYMGRKDQMSVPEGVPGLMLLVLVLSCSTWVEKIG